MSVLAVAGEIPPLALNTEEPSDCCDPTCRLLLRSLKLSPAHEEVTEEDLNDDDVVEEEERLRRDCDEFFGTEEEQDEENVQLLRLENSLELSVPGCDERLSLTESASLLLRLG